MDSTSVPAAGHPGYPRVSTAERLAHEAPLARLHVYSRALPHLERATELLELEAPADVVERAMRLRRYVGELMVEAAAEAVDLSDGRDHGR